MQDRLAHLYTPLDDAVAALHERHAASDARPADVLARRLMQRRYAVLFRQLATPNFEIQRFVAIATAVGLTPVILEFHRDQFRHCNPTKYALAKMHFHSGLGRQGGARLRCVTVADMTSANGRPLDQVQTRWGQSLIEFHHELLATDAALSAVEHHDASDWFHAHGGSARNYYPALFELFIDRAVLFENFLVTERELLFTTEIILPAFEAVCARRRQRPLICRLDPLEREGDPYWLQYPGELWPVVKTLADVQAGKVI